MHKLLYIRDLNALQATHFFNTGSISCKIKSPHNFLNKTFWNERSEVLQFLIFTILLNLFFCQNKDRPKILHIVPKCENLIWQQQQNNTFKWAFSKKYTKVLRFSFLLTFTVILGKHGIVREVWSNTKGENIRDFTINPNYPSLPGEVIVWSLFKIILYFQMKAAWSNSHCHFPESNQFFLPNWWGNS